MFARTPSMLLYSHIICLDNVIATFVAPKLPLRPRSVRGISCSSYLIHQTLSTVNTDLAALVPKWHVCDDKYPTELNFHADKISLQITRNNEGTGDGKFPTIKLAEKRTIVARTCT